MHNRYQDPQYQAAIGLLKQELKAIRANLGDTDKGNPKIQKIINDHWND